MAFVGWFVFEIVKGRGRSSKKNSSSQKGAESKPPPFESNDPYDRIREEILEKKAERQSEIPALGEEASVPVEVRATLEDTEKSTQQSQSTPSKPVVKTEDTSIYHTFKQQEKEILETQKKAKALLSQVSLKSLQRNDAQSFVHQNPQSHLRVSAQIRRNLKTQKAAQVALITGEILSSPLALRKN